MAFSSDIALNELSTTTSKTFTLVKQDGAGTERIDTSTSLTSPRRMTIKHTESVVKGVGTVDRHLLQFSHQKTGADGVARIARVNLTIEAPRHSDFPAASLKDLVEFCKLFAVTTANGNVDKLLIGDR